MRRKPNASWIKRKKLSASELHSRKKHGNRNVCNARKQSVKENESARPLPKILRKPHQDN